MGGTDKKVKTVYNLQEAISESSSETDSEDDRNPSPLKKALFMQPD